MADSFLIDDAAGNNNGSLDPGETADVYINISNNGQITTADAMAYLSTASSFVTINTSGFDLETIEAGETIEAMFNISIDESTPIGTIVDLNLLVEAGEYTLETIFYPKVGLIVEDFETGDFGEYEWEFGGNADWTIVNTGAYEGTYAAKSGSIGDQSETELKLTLEVAGSDSISFFVKVSSEATYDYLRFYIDNQLQDEWEGEVN